MDTPSSNQGATPARDARRRGMVGLAAVLALALAGCGPSQDGAAPGEVPTELSGPQEVLGVPGVVRWDLSPSGTQVFVKGSPQDAPILPDEAVITAFGTEITAFLDTVLTERNNGESTTFAASGLDVAGFEAAFDFTTGSVPDSQVVASTYLIEISHLGAPSWALVRVESTLVSLADQSASPRERRESFVFVPTPGSGAPQLVSFEAVE
ncbi:MAG: hypothetical protein RLZZ272_34 [Actinomycetota bacterium]|jgi:hypothetical protein